MSGRDGVARSEREEQTRLPVLPGAGAGSEGQAPARALTDLDLDERIRELKRERNAVILAHFYQDSEIQDVADFIGDSLQLAREAQRTSADVILFAGVHFMAETAKILNPTRIVLVPDMKAGCSLSDGCPKDRFALWRAQHPGAVAITYINCSAEVKALSDIICTSSNACRVVDSVPRDRKILFAPDRNLGRYVMKQTGREMELWPGGCIVHETFSQRKLAALRQEHPDAKVVAHPECEAPVLDVADYIGSTHALLNYVVNDNARKFIVVTESGILHEMKKRAPEKVLIPAPPDANCHCNECPFMRLNTPEKVYMALDRLEPRLEMTESLRRAAQIPLDRMLALG
jgi:quinolinate synthase